MRSTSIATLCAAGLLLAAQGCTSSSPHDEPTGIVTYDAGAGAPDGAIRPNRPVMTGEIAPVYGFATAAARVEYYYLGEVDRASDGTVPVNDIFFFYDERWEPLFRLTSDGSKLVGWHPVVDVVPTKTGYSPFWRINRVRVKGTVDIKRMDDLKEIPTYAESCQMDAVCPTGQRCIEDRCQEPITIGVFDLDAIKSRETLDSTKLVVVKTDTIINCPVVDANAKLLKGLSKADLPFPRVQLWYKRLKAFCYMMEGGKELLGAGLGSLPRDKAPPAIDAYFIRQALSFNTTETTHVLPKRNLVLTEHMPGTAGYSPLVKESSVFVDKDHTSKDVRSVAEAKAAGLKFQGTQQLHNLVVRGTIPACKTDDDCAGTGGKVDPPLKCSIEQGYCAPPFARLHEECRRGVKECDPKAGPAGTRLACVGLRVREKYFCFHACDSKTTDTNPDKEIDSRCGSLKNLVCFPLRQSDPTRPNGVCIQRCNSRAGNKDALIAECASQTCGDGKLDYGETCDDGNTTNKDGCNEFCTLSTFSRCDKDSDCKGTGQSCKAPSTGKNNTYCLPPADPEKDEREDKDKYRVTCMEFDYCWPPDDRGDWLGKKEEASK